MTGHDNPHRYAPRLPGALLPFTRRERPIAYYAVKTFGEEHWLVRHSYQGTTPISPYVNREIAQLSADHLNTLVRWEAPQTWQPSA